MCICSKLLKIMLICWIYLKFQIDYLNFLEEVEYTWLGANIIILYEEKKESSRCKMSFSLPKLVSFSQMHLPDFWKFQTDCLNPVEEVIIKHFYPAFAISRKDTRFEKANI